MLPRAGWKPLIRATSTVPPSVAVPETASWSYWLPAVVPPMSMSRAAGGGLGVVAVDRERARGAGAAGDDLAAVGDVGIDGAGAGEGTRDDAKGAAVECSSAEGRCARGLGVRIRAQDGSCRSRHPPGISGVNQAQGRPVRL